jgi:hypothetical protein
MPGRSRKKSGAGGLDPGHPGYLHTERLRDSERTTRKPLPLWDRVKFLALLVLLWLVLVWSDMANNPVIGFVDAARQQLHEALWRSCASCTSWWPSTGRPTTGCGAGASSAVPTG